MEKNQKESLSVLLIKTHNQLQQMVEKCLKEYDLTLEQWMVLEKLKDCQMASPTDLSQNYHKDRSYTTRLLDRLERRGLVIRTENHWDRRSVNVSLTDQGERFIRRVLPAVREAEQKIRELMGAAEYKLMVGLLGNMHNSITG